MPSIAVIGPGAIGGSLAALLLNNPQNTVVICARTPFECLRITHSGETEEHRPTIHTEPENLEPVDWIVLATKTYQVAASSAWLPQLSKSSTRLAVVQNGIEHVANLEPYFPVEQIVPVIIDCPIERKAPGQFVRHGVVAMQVPESHNSANFSSLFDHPAVTVTQTNSWKTAAWRKLALNCSGAISALVDEPATVAADPIAAKVMRTLILECLAVAKAEGCDIDVSLADTIIVGQAKAPQGSMNSLHADFVNRRPMEWDARNGVIARLGKKHGIPTPYNQLASELLSLMEKNYLS